MNRVALVAALVAIGLTWGLTIPLTKMAVSTGHQPLGLIFWQLLIATVLLSAISLLRGVGPALDRRALRFFAFVALLGTIFPNSASYVAAARLPAGVMGIVIASVPVFALAIALALGAEKLSARRGLGVLLSGAAVVLLIGPEASLPEPGVAGFVLLALLAPLCYGAEGNYIATCSPRDADPVSTLLAASAIGATIVGPLALATGDWVDPRPPWARAEWALVLSSGCHVVAYTGYIWLVGRAGAVFASQVSYVVTVSAVLLSGALLSELYSVWVWSALALMIAGLALVQPRAPVPRAGA